ncbi:hypothetical protein FC62_GL001397 [Amylolactobacillus amylotrophicus DSM 20534]|uniref:Uncharacterized protein n=2 Tax=Amylolactobacillus TaxID=2767876 RepID=A0A0R1YHG3_9LACO|nr:MULTISPECIES: hypothetical protein [Amylolactobacillus]KRK37282.1 hypothetical protein FC62_GL001397 [Amylolactobacillus amylotrophicus DSM 20534]KRM41681.1 hypothetical protein FD40_GL001243 [Amylolactobacillus amylophilus DSM 20533 = JCM 1125]GED80721.1 hypothetical protein LAM01_11940 [Amylolactobacillus amylophilus]
MTKGTAALNDDELYYLDVSKTLDEYQTTELYLFDLVAMRRHEQSNESPQKIEQTELV